MDGLVTVCTAVDHGVHLLCNALGVTCGGEVQNQNMTQSRVRGGSITLGGVADLCLNLVRDFCADVLTGAFAGVLLLNLGGALRGGTGVCAVSRGTTGSQSKQQNHTHQKCVNFLHNGLLF